MKPTRAPLDTTFGAVRAMMSAHVPPLTVERDVPGDYRLARSGVTAVSLTTTGDLVLLSSAHPGADPVIGPDLRRLRDGPHAFRLGAPDARVFEDIARWLAAMVDPPRRG